MTGSNVCCRFLSGLSS